jgi:hypothetical protein
MTRLSKSFPPSWRAPLMKNVGVPFTPRLGTARARNEHRDQHAAESVRLRVNLPAFNHADAGNSGGAYTSK